MIYGYGNGYLTKERYRDICKCDKPWKRFRGASKICVGNGFAHLVSYKTPICSFYESTHAVSSNIGLWDRTALSKPTIDDRPTLWLDSDACNYSRTTCKHLSTFLGEYVNSVDYYDVKSFLDDAATGEIKLVNGVWLVCI